MTQIINSNRRGLYIKFLVRMHKAWEETPRASRKKYLEFSKFTEAICRNFSITRSEAFDYVQLFTELGFIIPVKFRGFKLNYTLKDQDG